MAKNPSSMRVKNKITDLGVSRLAWILSRIVKTRTLVAARAAFARSNENAAEERMPAVFQPEALLPIQYYETLRRKHLLEGEKLLMFAVLEDAVESYMKYLHARTRKGQNRFREAETWIDREDKLRLFSFNNVCEALDIDPEYTRARN